MFKTYNSVVQFYRHLERKLLIIIPKKYQIHVVNYTHMYNIVLNYLLKLKGFFLFIHRDKCVHFRYKLTSLNPQI